MKLFNPYKISFALLGLLFVLAQQGKAQTDTTMNKLKITFPAYIQLAVKNNLGYAAEQFKVSIAQADAMSAKVFRDPDFSIGAVNHGQRRMKMGYELSTELGYTFELGGKRKARISLANRQAEQAQLLLNDYFRNLRADATIAFLTAMKEKSLLEVKQDSYERMKQLSISDSIRLKHGAITEIDARQSRLESVSLLNEVYQQEAVWKAALVNMNMLSGSKLEDILYNPSGDVMKFSREFNLAELIRNAQHSRPDLLAAVKNKEISKDMLRLAKANRVIDLGVTFGLTANSVVANAVAPTPSSGNVSVGLSIPLKFSNNNMGALKSANYTLQQSEVLYQQALLQIQVEVTQAYYNYQASQKQLKEFASGMLTDANKVLEGKIYSYKRGETSLLEVLVAQRSFNEVRQSYLETLNANAVALMELERTAGIWDINF